MPTVKLNGVDLYYELSGAGRRLVLTHGSWTDHTGWAPSLRALTERFEVVTWDRRGHSRSQGGDHPGSRDEDAADLAALIEHLGEAPVHVVGNSYGSIVVLTLVASRPELVASAVLHEPPLVNLLEGTTDPAIASTLAGVVRELDAVLALIEMGAHPAAAEYFVDQVALGPGSWARLPGAFRAVLEANAPTFLDERRDPTSGSIDAAALARTTVPLMFTYGTEGPQWYQAIIDELTLLVPAARVEVITGAGHIPHATHPDQWVATLHAFHQSITTRWQVAR
jgi:pimeloyl-ACP methyl ester carboxylesterase